MVSSACPMPLHCFGPTRTRITDRIRILAYFEGMRFFLHPYADALSASNSVSCHIRGARPRFGEGAIAPFPKVELPQTCDLLVTSMVSRPLQYCATTVTAAKQFTDHHTDWSAILCPWSRYSVVTSSVVVEIRRRRPTTLIPPRPNGTHPPVLSSRVITCAFTRTRQSSLNNTNTHINEEQEEQEDFAQSCVGAHPLFKRFEPRRVERN